VGDLEKRVTELELRFMHQENTIQELNETVYRQEQLIGRLERECSFLVEQFRLSAASSVSEPDGEERPPHY
jgi:SlyX protein